MMRNKYIRFFISSTFADMELERNLLQEVFEQLAKDYNERGWQIETIDLRWGISSEAGLDNKTMQICKEELTRCQQLSPKPNFIILQGDRYGWIPLPEKIPYSYWKAIKHVFKEDRRSKLFEKWYKLDNNALPEGEFVLQPRKKDDDKVDYRIKSIWEEQAEKPLKKAFYEYIKQGEKFWNQVISTFIPDYWINPPREFFGLSATELEISQGALSVSDAEEHVIGYFRHLTEVDEKHEEFLPENEENVILLKYVLKEILAKENTYEEKLSFRDYLPPSNPKDSHMFGERFKKEMAKRIRVVINNVIEKAESSVSLSENEIHLDFASSEAAGIIGRESELSYIDSYIKSPTDRKPKWIKAKSGTGKSVLMSKIATAYKDTHHVICRFCGHTPSSSRAGSLITSINGDLQSINPQSMQFGSPAEYFSIVHPEEPIILIIDALNQVEDSMKLQSLDWLFPYIEDNQGRRKELEFPKNIKVILSSLDNYKCTNQSHRYDSFQLGNMGDSAFALAYSRIHSAHRRLTSQQCSDLRSVIDKSDKNALYLHILGTYLAMKSDKEDISTIPYDLKKLVNIIFEDLERPERHGSIVKEVLSLLTIVRDGITDKEINTLLAENKVFYDSFKDRSFHQWNDHGRPSIPPILWSRLKYDLKPFLREKFSEYGLLNTFFHNGLKDIAKERYLTNCESYKFYYELLYCHWKANLSDKDPHALSELIHDGCLFAKYSTSDRNLYEDICKEIHSFMHKTELLKWKGQKGEYQLIADVEDVLKYIKCQERDDLELFQIRKLNMLPSSNHYRKTIDESGGISIEMTDFLANQAICNILYVVPALIDNSINGWLTAKRSIISEDGTKVVFISDGNKVKIEDLTDPSKSDSYIWQNPILEIQCSDDMRYHAIRLTDKCFKYDCIEKKIVESHPISEKGWMTLSCGGELFCESKRYPDLRQAMYAISGNFIWAICNNGMLRRCNKDITEYYEFVIDLKDDKDATLDNSEYIITTCTDNICIIANKSRFLILNFNCQTGSFMYTQIEHRDEHMNNFINLSDDIFRISSDEKAIFVYFHDENICLKYLFDEKGMLYSDDFCTSMSCINRQATKFLSFSTVCDIETEMKKYRSLIQVRADGVKHISASNDGRLIGVLSRAAWSAHSYMNLIFDYHQIKWRPPFSSLKYEAISAESVSPDGKYIVASTFRKDQFGIFTVNKENMASTCGLEFSVIQADGSCQQMAITDDSRYIAVANGEQLLVITPQGKTLHLYENIKILEYDGIIHVSSDNRHAIANDIIIDNISGKNHKMDFELHIFSYLLGNIAPIPILCPHPNPDIHLFSHGFISLSSRTVNNFKCHHEVASCSRSGRHLFFINNERLYISMWGSDQLDLLYEEAPVRVVIPAYNEDYIFIISEENRESDPINFQIIDRICLYDIKNRKVVQENITAHIAYFRLCAKGLIIAQKDGETHLFQPSWHYPFNRPAITTFVRRWNLEINQQDDKPTAICPMCGGRMTINPAIAKVLEDNHCNTRFEDWDKPGLYGHYCPHCKAELRFNPYIY